MPEIDPVILQLRADVAKYRVDVESVTRRVNDQLDSQGKAVVRLENQISRSSLAISSSFKSMAAGLAAGFSAREVANMADSYTRFTNQLKVAGLEGQNLAGVQERLFGVAQRNGVELESVGTLYSRAAQNQKELGASTEDLIGLTRAVAASLRISGTSTNEASGALLQLGQALGSPRVQAEEFNSLLDTMQPLLREASKYIDGTGNSISGLTRLIKDQNGPGVSNVELFRAITSAMAGLEVQAGRTTLTIGGAFTTLSNALTKFVGEADSANGATVAITTAITALADNLGTVTEAVAVLAAIMLGRFAAGMAAGAASTAAASTAVFALQARAAGAATTMEALALVGGVAGRSLLAAFGGPVGLAVTALTLGVTYFATASQNAATASKTLADQTDATSQFQADLNRILAADPSAQNAKNANALAAAHRNAANAAYERAAAELALRRTQASDALELAQRGVKIEYRGRAGKVEVPLDTHVTRAGSEQRRAQILAQQALDRADREKAQLDKAHASALAYKPVAVAPVSAPASSTSAKKGRTSSGGSAPKVDVEAIARRFQDDLEQGELEARQAQADAIGTAEARRDVDLARIAFEKQSRERAINADKDLNSAQKAALLASNERTAAARQEAVAAAARRDAQEKQRQAEDNSARYSEDALRADASLATTRQASLEANLRILDSLEAQERSHLEAQIAAGEIADAEKARADLARTQAARRTTTGQDHESPLAAYSRKLNETDLGDQAESLVVDELNHVQDGIANALTNAIGTKDPLINGLINLLIQEVIMKPLAAALAQSLGGAGGGLGGILGSVIGAVGGLFGGGGAGLDLIGGPMDVSGLANTSFSPIPQFASGTNYAPGGLAVVGEQGPELVHLPRGARVIPNHMMKANAAASMVGVTAANSRSLQQTVVVKVEANDYFDAKVKDHARSVATPIAERSANRAASAAYMAGQQSAPGTLNKYNQLKG